MTDQNKEPQEGNQEITDQVLKMTERLHRDRQQIEKDFLTDSLIDLVDRTRESVNQTEGYTAALMRGRHMILETLKGLDHAHAEYIKSDEWQKLTEKYPGIEPLDAFFMAYLTKDLIEYEPEIKELYKQYQEDQGQEIPFRRLLYEPAPDDMDTGLMDYFILKAQEIRKERRGELPKETVRPVTKADYPLDKVNAFIWSLLTEDQNGQLTFFAMESQKGKNKKKKQELNLTYTIDFNALEEEGAKVSKRLTPTDKRVYIAISALFNAGNTTVTTEQIHKAMGGTSSPSVSQRTRINESVYKMGRAWITINDAQEHEAYNYDIDEHRPGGKGKGWTGGVYDGPLLPMERGQAIINGKLADAAIHLFREPPLLTFAKLRHQLTTIDIKLLQSSISKTDGNLLIEDYLLTRIARAKNTKGKRAEKILFKTLFEKTGITDKKQQRRTPAKVESYLKFYKEQYFIDNYKMEPDSATVYF